MSSTTNFPGGARPAAATGSSIRDKAGSDARDRGPAAPGDDRDDERGGGRRFGRRRVCRFCADTTLPIDYKDTNTLRYFTSERGKIIPRRISGNCQKHQKQVARSIKQARNVAMLPYVSSKI